MRNDPLGIDPPAIVKQAECSIADLEKKINEAWPRYQARGREFTYEGSQMGEWLRSVKARMPGKFKEWVGAKMKFTYGHALRLVKLAEEDRENPNSAALVDISLSERLERNLKILSEESPAKEVAPKPAVPFTPANPPEPEPEREPGIPSADEEEQDRMHDAKIKAALCLRCSRIGQPSCDLCRGKAARIREGESVKPGVRTKPNDPRDKGPKNGQLIFDWTARNGQFGAVVRSIDQVCNGYGIPVVHPEAEALRKRLGDWDRDFKAFAEKVSKQKVPQA